MIAVGKVGRDGVVINHDSVEAAVALPVAYSNLSCYCRSLCSRQGRYHNAKA